MDDIFYEDVTPGNVLRAEREPWLMIDPKPFVGDAALENFFAAVILFGSGLVLSDFYFFRLLILIKVRSLF